MLLRFKVENYRSIRDEAVLDFEAAGFADQKECLLLYKTKRYLPVISIHGKNGGGKSNVIRAMWLAATFIKNAQRTQTEDAEIPVRPFALNNYSQNTPTTFCFEYVDDGIWYEYGFSATRREIIKEHLYWAPKGQKSVVFERKYQIFSFPTNGEKKHKEMLSKAVAANQLFLSIASTMNYMPVNKAMHWFRTKIFFSRDYADLGNNLLEYGHDPRMIQSIIQIAKTADLGIIDMQFEMDHFVFRSLEDLPDSLSHEERSQIELALHRFKENLSAEFDEASAEFQFGKLRATSFHMGLDGEGKAGEYPLGLMDESDGTIRLMARAAAMESALSNGGVFVVDEIENRLHPKLVEYIIQRFQNKNRTNAQLVFTSHSVEILHSELLRRDQYYLVDKDVKSGATELYSISDFSVRNDEKIGKAYLQGKYGAVPFIMEE